MTTLAEQLASDLKDAMRSGETIRRDEIRGLLAALRAERMARLTRELDKRGLILRNENEQLSPEQAAEADRLRAELDLSADDQMAVLLMRVKQHRQSIEDFQKGGRADLVATERAQLAVLEQYLPRQLDSDAVEGAIQAAIARTGAQGMRDQGKVMGLLSQQLRGQADMKLVSARVQSLLGAR